MSHFSRINTYIYDLATLKSVLTQLDISWEKNSKQLEINKKSLELIFSQPNSIELGFRFNDKKYEFVTDKSFWQQIRSVESFIIKINQTYTAKLLTNELKNLGFSAIRCIKTHQGVIDLVAEKWISEKRTNLIRS